MLFEVVTALECRMSGPWRSPGRDREREAATFPTPVPRWLKHNLARPHKVNGDWKWTLLLWMTLFSLGVGFPKRWSLQLPHSNIIRASTMIELGQITMSSQSARSETNMENALQPIRNFLSWRIPLTSCWGWIQEWIEKDKNTTSIMMLEIHFVIKLVGLTILPYYKNSFVICKIDDCLMFRFFSVDVGNQFSRRTPPSILSRQYLAKLGLTLPVERYWGILATIWKRQGDSFWNKKGRHRTIWMVYPFDVDFSLNPMMDKGGLSESKKR